MNCGGGGGGAPARESVEAGREGASRGTSAPTSPPSRPATSCWHFPWIDSRQKAEGQVGMLALGGPLPGALRVECGPGRVHAAYAPSQCLQVLMGVPEAAFTYASTIWMPLGLQKTSVFFLPIRSCSSNPHSSNTASQSTSLKYSQMADRSLVIQPKAAHS